MCGEVVKDSTVFALQCVFDDLIIREWHPRMCTFSDSGLNVLPHVLQTTAIETRTNHILYSESQDSQRVLQKESHRRTTVCKVQMYSRVEFHNEYRK